MSRPVFLTAAWRHLCFVNYAVEPAVLQAHLPFGTELDLYNGKTFVSVVAFMFYDTKALGVVPAFFCRTFEEINLRFYVLRREGGQVKRGVVFIKEVVPKALLAWIARAGFKENYVAMQTSHRIEQGQSYHYGWGANSLRLESDGARLPAIDGSFERWITEHYWGYTRINDHKSYEYEVKHPAWDLYKVSQCVLEADLAGLYGEEFRHTFSVPPASVFLADGSQVSVHFPRALK